MAEGVLDALQWHFGVGAWHLAEVEKQVVEGLQEVVVALGTNELCTLLCATLNLGGGLYEILALLIH